MKVVVHVTTAGTLVADKADARSAGSVAVAAGESLVLQLHGSPSSVLFSSRVALRVFSKEETALVLRSAASEDYWRWSM